MPPNESAADPLGDIISRVPDNLRAEMARRGRMSGETLADLLHISYATFKRRMARPGEFTLGDIANAAIALKVPVLRIFEIDQERPR
jgi:hypothetical protein